MWDITGCTGYGAFLEFSDKGWRCQVSHEIEVIDWKETHHSIGRDSLLDLFGDDYYYPNKTKVTYPWKPSQLELVSMKSPAAVGVTFMATRYGTWNNFHKLGCHPCNYGAISATSSLWLEPHPDYVVSKWTILRKRWPKIRWDCPPVAWAPPMAMAGDESNAQIPGINHLAPEELPNRRRLSRFLRLRGGGWSQWMAMGGTPLY